MAKPIKQTRAVSHKKKNILSIAVKEDMADKKRCAVPISPTTKKKKKNDDNSGVDNFLALLSSPKRRVIFYV